MIDVKLGGRNHATGVPDSHVRAFMDGGNVVLSVGSVVQSSEDADGEFDVVESSDVVLDDPDAVGALADALRRIERRMRELRSKP